MTRIAFAPSAKALLRCRNLLVVAPKRVLKNATLGKVLDRRLQNLLGDLAKDADPGLNGVVSSTLTGRTPQRLSVGALPDAVSRHNSPARAEAIRNVVASAGLGSRGRAGVLLVLEDPEHTLAAVNAVGRGLPTYSAKSSRHDATAALWVVDTKGALIEPSDTVEHTLVASRDSAELVDTPPSELNPAEFASRARALLSGIKGVKIREIVGDALLKQGLGGIHAVGRSATAAPRMLIASYDPKSNKKGHHIALVGKGVTYDTGGLHIKMRGFMETMKADMGGAAAVLGAFRVLTQTGCRHRLSLLLCMAENAIGPAAYKPDDILTMHSGKTVEINNTDAEGRLLLADGVSYASRVLKASHVFDAATLTGAQMIATGKCHAAVVTNDADLEAHVVASGLRTGDLCHPLPFCPEFYKSEFSSPIADMRNSVANRANAQASCAAQFVYWHMEDAPGHKRRRWCHVDLAGPAFPKDRATGFGVALLSEAIGSLA